MNNFNIGDIYCPACNSNKISLHSPISKKYKSPKLWPKFDEDINEWRLLECSNCSHVFVDSDAYSRTYYSTRQAEPEQHSHFFKEQPHSIILTLKEIYKFTGKKKLRILDFGCAYGVKGKLLASHGHDVIGYDIAEKQADYAAKEFNIKTYSGEWNDVKNKIGLVDVIFSEHVFEHIPYPLKTLISLKENLRGNGILALSVPNFDSNQVGYLMPEHLQYFNQKSIKKLVSSAGFNLISIRAGLPLISKYYKLTRSVPPLPIVQLIDKITTNTGHFGYSLNVCATPIK